MAGILVEYRPDFGAAREVFALEGSGLEDLVFAIGELMVNQTKTRIADEKRGPEGEVWAPWSPAYAASRSGRHSLLVGEGNPGLLESITNHSVGMEAIAGTNLVYAARHHFGDDTMPARPYLGLSGENRREIEELAVDGIEGLLQ